jgi:hypothetical protein
MRTARAWQCFLFAGALIGGCTSAPPKPQTPSRPVHAPEVGDALADLRGALSQARDEERWWALIFDVQSVLVSDGRPWDDAGLAERIVHPRVEATMWVQRLRHELDRHNPPTARAALAEWHKESPGLMHTRRTLVHEFAVKVLGITEDAALRRLGPDPEP